MAKDAYYFPHDSNAQHDEKILQLRSKYGWQGYGLYWAIIEKLRESKDYKFSLEALSGLSLSLSHPQAELQALLDDCYTIGLLEKMGGYFHSESLTRRMEEIDARRESLREFGRRGGIASSQAKAKLKPPSSSKVKESKGKKRKEAPHTNEEFLSQLKNTYPHIDLDTELKKMDGWLLLNPSRKKSRRFVINWLNRVEKPLNIEKKSEGYTQEQYNKLFKQ